MWVKTGIRNVILRRVKNQVIFFDTPGVSRFGYGFWYVFLRFLIHQISSVWVISSVVFCIEVFVVLLGLSAHLLWVYLLCKKNPVFNKHISSFRKRYCLWIVLIICCTILLSIFEVTKRLFCILKQTGEYTVLLCFLHLFTTIYKVIFNYLSFLRSQTLTCFA